SLTLWPRGVIAPMPVTTTRLRIAVPRPVPAPAPAPVPDSCRERERERERERALPFSQDEGRTLAHLGEADLYHVRLRRRAARAGQYGDRTLGVGLFVVQRGWRDAVSQGENACGQLGRPAAGAEVAKIALRSKYRHRLLAIPENLL